MMFVPGVVFRGIDPPPGVLEAALAWRKNPSPAVMAFLDIVQEVFRALAGTSAA